jgi:probable rRNA maturation factor
LFEVTSGSDVTLPPMAWALRVCFLRLPYKKGIRFLENYQIEISNNQECLEIDEEELIDVVRRTLEAERVSAAEISVALIDDAAMHELNRRHLDHDYPTDVLSFLLDCDEMDADKTSGDTADGRPSLRGAGKRLEGEVIISTETAVQESAKYHWSPRDEIVLYLVHGLLHLCGYDDQTQPERELMRSREQAILTFWNLTPHYSESEDMEPPDGEAGSQSAGGHSGAET